MIRYYKLFDLLNRKGMKKSDLRQILSSTTVAKLSKGEYISGEAIEKICMFLECQPGDIMEVITVLDEKENGIDRELFIEKKYPDEVITIYERSASEMPLSQADEERYVERHIVEIENLNEDI